MIRDHRKMGDSIFAALFLFTLLFLAACGSSVNLDEPPDIQYGEEVCAECNMIISETRFATSYVTPDGQVHVFDDIGDMLAYIQKHGEEVHIYWVHDLNSEEWVDAAQASYILNPEMITPMGWGLAAFRSPAEAQSFAADNGGTVTTWPDLLEAVESGDLDPASLTSHIHAHPMDQEEGQEGMDMDNSPDNNMTETSQDN